MPGLDWGTILMQYARAIGWSITAAVGFAFGIGIALKVFDMLSTDIDEWEEIKKGNIKFLQGDWTLPDQDILEFLGENMR